MCMESVRIVGLGCYYLYLTNGPRYQGLVFCVLPSWYEWRLLLYTHTCEHALSTRQDTRL